MNKLAWRALAIAVPLLFAVYLIYPTIAWYQLPAAERADREMLKDPLIAKTINLGLDLRGGTHLLLEIQTDKIGGNTIEEKRVLVTDAIDRAIEIIRNRIDQFGVAEPLIARQGEKWIVVQLPGIKDPERAKALIGKTALLEFRIVDDSQAMENISTALREKNISFSSAALHPETLPKEVLSLFPTGYVLMSGRESRWFLVKSVPEMTGASLINAKVQLGGGTGFGYPEVAIEFNDQGARQFSQVTETNINRNLAIVLDGTIQSAPTIRTRIPDGKAVIEGSFTTEEAKLLSTVLRAGALPAPVEVIEERTVGPTLGEDSIRAGLMSTLIGVGLIIGFMAFYYRGAGVLTDFALVFNLILLLGSMSYFHSTLTLPGIAGIILSLAMAVDANVLILERIREELRSGKTTRMAIDLGYEKAFSAILDSNLTTLIAALFLFQFGTGPVKGFAVTLTIGILFSMFSAVFVTRTYYEWRLSRGNYNEMSI
jgi:protein-export membrane protein SecD